MSDAMLNTLMSGVTALIVAGGAVFIQWYTARAEREKRKAEIEAAAREAKETLAREVRKDSLTEWQGLADERKNEIAALRAEDADQQKQIDGMKVALADCQRQHEECKEKHVDCEKRVEGMQKQIERHHSVIRQSADRISSLEQQTGLAPGGKS